MPDQGRPSSFTKEAANRICQRLADGETLRAICRDDGMPAESTVRGWALDRPEFSAQYARAREIGYQALADEIIEISDDSHRDWIQTDEQGGEKGYGFNAEHVQRSRLRIDTRKWLLSKALPKVYGDKVEHTGPDGGPLVITWQPPSA